jgi:methionine--tRNA ligase beta chain
VKEEDLGIVIATVRATEPVPGSQRLHRIVLEVGDGSTLQIASGIAGDFEADYLVGKQIPILINVDPIKVRGVLSQARFLATSGEDGRPVLLHPERPVPAGSKVW